MSTNRQMIDKILRKKPPERFTGGYFGVRNASFFTPAFKKYVFSCKSFTDLTAGTGQFPYSVAMAGLPVNVNDRCYYSSIILSCLFNKDQPYSDEPPENYLKNWHGALQEIKPGTGYLSENHMFLPRSGQIFRKDTAGYIDAIIAKGRHDPFMLYGVGKTLLRWTFRGRQFCAVGPKKRPLKTITPKEVLKWVLEEIHGIRQYAGRLPYGTPTKALYGDALQAAETLPIKDGFVYVDPAWPWSQDLGGKNPYLFYTDILSSILAQKKVSIPAWERTNSEDEILEEVASWMQQSFDRGAKYFCVCTQDTNYPAAHRVYRWMNLRFQKIRMITITDVSMAANRNYTNFWGIYQK